MALLSERIVLERGAGAEQHGLREDGTRHVLPDLAYKRLFVVNVAFFGNPDGYENWVLVDAGVPGTLANLREAAARRFGGRAPSAIVLTHAHPDHIGCLRGLCELWDVPVYAHPLEHPYINGASAYSSPDSGAGGGLLSRASLARELKPLEANGRLHALPQDGSVPFMPGWRWLHTPGHSAGHISLWRESDRCLIAGDALLTTSQQSAYAITCTDLELSGPPRALTQDWQLAGESLRNLAALQPNLLLSSHGRALRGEAMRRGLERLALTFKGE
jgi:glyoxylase-like metal-dependent hydrolase (beta-lactamase superfamily II)